MAVQVKCCIYNNDPRIIDKRPTLIKTLECRITDPMNMVDPIIFLEYSKEVEKCNYFVINFRKYFKVKLMKESNRSLRISLHEDVVSTWLPRVYVVGEIVNASKITSEDVEQKFLLNSNKHISRILANEFIGPVDDEPITIIQSPQPTKFKREG